MQRATVRFFVNKDKKLQQFFVSYPHLRHWLKFEAVSVNTG